MSEEPAENRDAEEGEEGEGKPKRAFGMVKIAMFGLPPILILAAGLFFMLSSGESPVTEGDEPPPPPSKPSLYMDMPDMVVNLSAVDNRSQYLKIKVALEAKEQAALDAIEPMMPRVLDLFQVYLRELRSSDLDGSAGIFRLKEELLRRINLTIHPNRVDRVLFKEIIVQ